MTQTMPQPGIARVQDVDLSKASHVAPVCPDASRAGVRFTERTGVLWLVHDDAVVILSLLNGRYFTLEGPAASVWIGLMRGLPLESLPSAPAPPPTFSPPRPRLTEAEVAHFVRKLLERELIEPVPVAPDQGLQLGPPGMLERMLRRWLERQNQERRAGRSDRLRLPSWLTCFIGLGVVHMALRILGLRRTLRLLWLSSRADVAVDLPSNWMDALARRARIAIALYPVATDCLERSLLVWWAGRLVGGDMAFRIGARVFPFAAHAWAEYRNHPVTDSPDVLLRFQVFRPLEPRDWC